MSLNPKFFARLLLLAILCLMVLMFAGCRSKKASTSKKQEKSIEITTKDIKTSNDLNIETTAFKVSNSQNFSIEPVNNDKPVQVISGRDTMNFSNAKINFNKTITKEDSATKTTQKELTEDNSGTSKESELTDLKKEKKVVSSSWGTNIGIIFGILAIACGLYLHFSRPKPL
jgi:hypothetical protein